MAWESRLDRFLSARLFPGFVKETERFLNTVDDLLADCSSSLEPGELQQVPLQLKFAEPV
jgi:hypothetical protein